MSAAAVRDYATSSPAEARRRFVVKAVLFIYVLSLIEGPLRKWFLPGMAGPLTLMRDPFVIALYAYCAAAGLIWTRGIARLWLSLASVTTLLGLVQYSLNGHGITGWILGVRTYWLYMPFAFVVAKTFRYEDVCRFLRLNLWIAMPYAVLVASQYNAPPSAFINFGVGADDAGAVGLNRQVLRPFGLFTYTDPNVQFTAAMIAMFVASYVSAVPAPGRALFLLASGAAVGTMSVLTGSRSIYFFVAVILGLTILGLTMARPTGRTPQRMLGILGFVALAALLFIYAFPDMLEAMAGRLEHASRSEGSIWQRAIGSLIGWIEPLLTGPLWGAGIGSGAPGVARFIGAPSHFYGESDLQRNVNELGFVAGIAMLLLRFVTVGWLIATSYRLAEQGKVMALPIAGFAVLPFLAGQITNSPINAFLVWTMLGLLLSLTAGKSMRPQGATRYPVDRRGRNVRRASLQPGHNRTRT